jgi:hypothetical protein
MKGTVRRTAVPSSSRWPANCGRVDEMLIAHDRDPFDAMAQHQVHDLVKRGFLGRCHDVTRHHVADPASEIGTAGKSPGWLTCFLLPGQTAERYTMTHVCGDHFGRSSSRNLSAH